MFPEYTVGCIYFDHTSNHNRDSEFSAYYGKIDLYIKAPSKIHIGVEFDNAATIKHASIRKFLQSNANICIGIIHGPRSKKYLDLPEEQLIENSIKKFKALIEEVMYFYDVTRDVEKHRFLKAKIFYLGIVNRQIFVDITPFIRDLIINNKRD